MGQTSGYAGGMRGRLFPTEGDWCEWHQDPPLAGTVLVRVTSDGGRLVLAGLRIEGMPTAELLRAIPVGRIEAAANAQLTIVDDVVVPAPQARWPNPRPHLGPSGDGGWETPDPNGAVTRPTRRGPAPPADNGGAGRGRPDAFYRELARAYLQLAQDSTRPVAVLAESNGVPVTTAHRWIKEARRRGFLPPGRPGKAG
jgi:hypothetical protein